MSQLSLHVIADSISMHYGPFLEKYLPDSFAYSRKGESIGGAPNPEGRNGQDSPMVVEYIRRCIAEAQRWDLVLLNCGLWDIRDRSGVLQNSLDAYVGNLETAYELLTAVCRNIVWVRTTPVDDELHNRLKQDYWRHDRDVVRYNEAADAIALRHGASIIDLYTFTKSLDVDNVYLDHIHFTDETRRLQASFIAGELAGLFGRNGAA
jgi:GDSL-like Lipase/Acylhydrolase family